MPAKKLPKPKTDEAHAAERGARTAYQEVAVWLYDEAIAALMAESQDAADRLRTLWKRCPAVSDRVGGRL